MSSYHYDGYETSLTSSGNNDYFYKGVLMYCHEEVSGLVA